MTPGCGSWGHATFRMPWVPDTIGAVSTLSLPPDAGGPVGGGSYFGEVALLCNVHRTMDVRAVTHALVFVIERTHLMNMMAKFPADMTQLLLAAATRYRKQAKTGFAVMDGDGSPARRRTSSFLSQVRP